MGDEWKYFCGECDWQVLESTDVCPNCGTDIRDVEDVRSCQECDSEVPESMSYCLSCKAPVSSVLATMDLVAPNAQLANVNFNGWDLSGADLSAATLSRAGFRNAVLSEANLDRAKLVWTLFEEANLEGATLTNVRLRGAVFKNANLQGANLDWADNSLRDEGEAVPKITCWDLDQVSNEGVLDTVLSNIYGANRPSNQDMEMMYGRKVFNAMLSMTGTVNKLPVEYSDLDLNLARKVYASIIDLDFQGANMRRVSAQGAFLGPGNFTGANMAGINLRGASLSGSTLDSACLKEATLRNATLMECSIKNADLSYTNLHMTQFWASDLTNSTFKGADLTGASFNGADLTNADFSETVFKGTEFAGSNYEEARLTATQLATIKAAVNDLVEKNRASAEMWEKARLDENIAEKREEPSNVEDPTLSDRDANALILQGSPYLWVSTAIGGSTPLQMIRAMQADGISELDALVQMCEAGFDAFCRSLADTANVKGAPDYYKGRERDLYKTELLKVLTEHYGRPRAEQVIDRLSNL